VHSDVVDGDDVRMIESGSRARFLLEAAQAIYIFRGRGTNQFEGDVTTEPLVPGTINLTHTAGADLLQHLVMT
jgi:hypothetical protein